MNRLSMLAAAVVVLVSMQGCATHKELVPTGGSRSDGTVKLSYEYGSFEVPKLDADQGMAVAKKRCAAWGYTDAEPFGGSTKHCANGNAYGCNRWMVTVEYQCTGTPQATK